MVVEYFIQYIRGGQFKYPMIFYVTLDGSDGTYWFCQSKQIADLVLRLKKEKFADSIQVKNAQLLQE